MKFLIPALLAVFAITSCVTRQPLTAREQMALFVAHSKAQMSLQTARMEIVVGRAPPQERELANATLVLVKRMVERSTSMIDQMNTDMAHMADIGTLMRLSKTQDDFLSIVRKGIKQYSGYLEARTPVCQRFIREAEADLDRFERDFSHLGGKRIVDSLRMVDKTGAEKLNGVLAHQKAVVQATQRSLDYLNTRRADWIVVSGLVKFVNSAAKRSYRLALGEDAAKSFVHYR